MNFEILISTYFFKENTHVIINNEYESISNENLLNLANWVHHISYILPQGRVTWENPYIFTRGGEAEEEEDEEGEGSQSGDNDKNEGKNLEPEQGPAILTPLTGDDGKLY